MKIGILTFHRAHNYGAVLQAFALQKCLQDFGYDVKFIDYRNSKLLKVYKVFDTCRLRTKNPLLFLRKLFNEINFYTVRHGRSKAFEKFICDNLHVDSNINLEYINANYDVVIVGSDQVWNFHLTRGFDDFYWGNFRSNDCKLKLVSYAASMEVSELSNYEQKKVADGLRNFDSISVREDSLKDNLQPLTDNEISVVVDPTLLLDSSLWIESAKNPDLEAPYLLLYQVRNNSKNEFLAKKIARQLNLKIVYLSARADIKNSKEFISASPSDYLGLFKCASFIVCSSFHGTVFSILFKVPFYSVMMNDGKDSRSISLLKSLGLANRGVNYDSTFSEDRIDWDAVHAKLDNVKKISIDYLKNSLS